MDAAKHLRDHAFGISSSLVHHIPEPEKSVSREHTFDTDEHDREKVRARLLELAEEVGRRFRGEMRWAKTARLKLRNAAFETITRQSPFDAPVRDDISIRRKALELFEREKFGAIRLIGFGLTDIRNSPGERGAELFADPDDERRRRRERLSETLDDLHRRGLLG